MNDAYSLFRYTLPGIVFILELTFCLLLLDFDGILKILKSLQNQTDYTLLGIFITFFTIGVGSIFTLIYRSFPSFKIDYSSFLEELNKQKLISKTSIPFPFKDENEYYENAWVITSAIWYERSETENEIKGSKERSLSLANLMHNAAASMIGSFFIFLILIFYLYYKHCQNILFTNFILSISLSISLFAAHLKSFIESKKALKNFTELVIWDTLKKSKKKS
ncbi:hypothetical protein EHQ43_17635 [Leptospira bouyouniensis]|uniref:Uncharacterized protein n=1 Tax=Leptospira bouyouniensis TaxID=2484911 RepID=A0A7I0HMD6_9LEPT|nr:hypothetical protein [Leptospira bouyouniensis]TGL02181.1 hypothetical protein EHQ43_17635 [Leptospira bouyouniensis]